MSPPALPITSTPVSYTHLDVYKRQGLLAQPAVVSVIAGVSQPEQVLANVEAAEWVPSPEDLEELDAIAPSERPAEG